MPPDTSSEVALAEVIAIPTRIKDHVGSGAEL